MRKPISFLVISVLTLTVFMLATDGAIFCPGVLKKKTFPIEIKGKIIKKYKNYLEHGYPYFDIKTTTSVIEFLCPRDEWAILEEGDSIFKKRNAYKALAKKKQGDSIVIKCFCAGQEYE